MPEKLRAARYDLEPIGEGERIIAGSITEKLTLTAEGTFEPATEGSTGPVHVRSHSGICPVKRFSFAL